MGRCYLAGADAERLRLQDLFYEIAIMRIFRFERHRSPPLGQTMLQFRDRSPRRRKVATVYLLDFSVIGISVMGVDQIAGATHP